MLMVLRGMPCLIESLSLGTQLVLLDNNHDDGGRLYLPNSMFLVFHLILMFFCEQSTSQCEEHIDASNPAPT